MPTLKPLRGMTLRNMKEGQLNVFADARDHSIKLAIARDLSG
jgi:hypothetical protein